MKKKTEKWEVFIKNGRTKIISILTINFGHPILSGSNRPRNITGQYRATEDVRTERKC